MKNQTKRIDSIDILRGLDLFLLLFLQPVIISIPFHSDSTLVHSFLFQLDHEKWVGFRFWDLVMPLFLFLVGASMPFSFAKYKESGQRKRLYLRILRRVVLLFVLGMIVQGNLLALSIESLEIYNNTLQAIAAGYLISAIILLNCGVKVQVVLTFLLMAVYSVPMRVYGIYEPDDSFAFQVDKVVIGGFRGDLTYTWVWSSLTFGATVMFGALSGEIIKKYKNSNRFRPVGILTVSGIALMVFGLLFGFYEPIIKRIWTSSMTMYSAGICMLLLALFYWLVDLMRFQKGINWFKIYGVNAITAYCLGEVINFRSVVNSLTFGLERIIPEWYPFILTLGNSIIIFLILYLLYRSKILLKI